MAISYARYASHELGIVHMGMFTKWFPVSTTKAECSEDMFSHRGTLASYMHAHILSYSHKPYSCCTSSSHTQHCTAQPQPFPFPDGSASEFIQATSQRLERDLSQGLT